MNFSPARLPLILMWLLLLLIPTSLQADNWPCFRGLNHDGISKEKNWRTVWPKAGLQQVWGEKVGIGFSSVSVANGMAFTLGHTGGKDTLYCLDAKTGRKIWDYSWPSAIGAKFYIGGPGSTPTVEGDHV